MVKNFNNHKCVKKNQNAKEYIIIFYFLITL